MNHELSKVATEYVYGTNLHEEEGLVPLRKALPVHKLERTLRQGFPVHLPRRHTMGRGKDREGVNTG